MWHVSIGQVHFIIKSGGLIPLLLMVPNFLWMALPPTSTPEGEADEPLWLGIIENIGRIAVLLLPFFYVLDFDRRFSRLAAIAMAGSLIVYYAGWVRYFFGGRSYAWLKAPLLGVPIPLAVFPVIFLLLSSCLMNSWAMLAAAVFFGVTHLWVSSMGL